MITQKINFNSQNKPISIPYYHREYKNDIQKVDPKEAETSWLHQAQRVGFLALPFLSLYKPFSFPISLGMGVVRIATSGAQLAQAIQAGEAVSTSYQLLQLAISVVALAGTIFAHPVGMIITTIHDLAIESAQLISHLEARNYTKALESALTILSNALYLAAIGAGGIELHIASLAMQILLGIYQGCKEGQQGHLLEMAAHIAMAGIRGKQLHDQCKILQMKRAFEQMVTKRSIQTEEGPEEKKIPTQPPIVCKPRDPHTEAQIREELKQLGFDPLTMPKSGNTVLHQAVQKGNLRATELALDYGFDIGAQNNAGDTALHIAAGKGQLEITQYLVHRGADINKKNNLDQLAFHKGVKYENIVSYFESLGYQREIPIREWAVVEGLRPDFVDSQGNTFLHRLVKMKHHEGLKYAIQENYCLEQLNIENKQNFRPIDIAIEQKDRGSLQIFITNFQDRYIRYKNLHQAAHVGWKEGLEMLFPFYDQKSLANPKESLRLEILRETEGMPTAVPIYPGASSTISLEKHRENLLSQRYQNYRATYPKTLLQEAVYSGDLDTVKLLVDYGCPINGINYGLSDKKTGFLGRRKVIYPVATPLALAEYFHPENQELLNYLQKLGAVTEIKNEDWDECYGDVHFQRAPHELTMEQFFSPSPGPAPFMIGGELIIDDEWENFGKKAKAL